MKTLLLLRHAKSSWDSPELADFDRPLAKRGLKDAPRVGKFLKGTKLPIDLVLSSTAKRARTTAELVAKAASISNLKFTDVIYEAGVSDLLGVIRSIENEHSAVVLVGHNPGFEHLLHQLCGPGASIRVPTAALGCIELDIDKWAEVDSGTGTLLWFVAPRVLGPSED